MIVHRDDEKIKYNKNGILYIRVSVWVFFFFLLFYVRDPVAGLLAGGEDYDGGVLQFARDARKSIVAGPTVLDLITTVLYT